MRNDVIDWGPPNTELGSVERPFGELEMMVKC